LRGIGAILTAYGIFLRKRSVFNDVGPNARSDLQLLTRSYTTSFSLFALISVFMTRPLLLTPIGVTSIIQIYIILYFISKFHLQPLRASRECEQVRINIRMLCVNTHTHTHTHRNINRMHLEVYEHPSGILIEMELSAPFARVFRSEVNENVREYSRYIRRMLDLFN